MRNILFVVMAAVALPGVNCIDSILGNLPGGHECTTLYAYGLSVGLTNADSGVAISNATLTLTEGTYQEVLERFPGSGDYVGAGERAGTYTLTIQAPGYLPKTIENILITADECHVKGVRLDIPLQPAS